MHETSETNTVAPTIAVDADGAPAAGSFASDGPPPPTIPPPPRGFWRGPWPWILGIPILTIAIVSVAFAFWERPYYALSPGGVRETTERVGVSGADVYLPDGDIGFVTVRLTERVSMWEYLGATFDDDVELVEEERINGDNTAEEKRELDRRRMQDSKDDASVIALEYLGYEVPRIGLGVEVAGLIDCMPAEGELIVGDLILDVDGEPTPLRLDLVEILRDKGAGDRVELRVDRITDGRIELVEIVLGSSHNPCLAATQTEGEPSLLDEPERPMLGINLSGSDLVDYDLPVDIEINSDRVGGPSAGLAFALAIIDVLTPGELTGGNSVATTGTIDINGNVGPVGGVHQKTVAAREAGVEMFIVPSAEVAGSVAAAGDMRVVGVDTLQDALVALSDLGGNGLDVTSPPDLT